MNIKIKNTSSIADSLAEYIKKFKAAKNYRLPPERVLAEKLGCSRSTISRTLSLFEGEGIIERKHGSGNYISTRGSSSSMTIAVVMRGAYYSGDVHFRKIIEITSKHAEKHNIYIQIYDRIIDMFADNPENNPLMNVIKNRILDGILIISRIPMGIVSRIIAICPAVAVNNIFGDGEEISCFSCDHFRAGLLAGKHLIEKGHNKIAYLTPSMLHPEAIAHLSGLKSALEMAGMAFSRDDILESRVNFNIFTKKVSAFFKKSDHTACFVRNDIYAARLISLLGKKGIAVPENISIIGCGNHFDNSNNSNLTISSIDCRIDEMCRSALKVLAAKISGQNRNTEIKLLEPRLIERGSVKNIRQD